MCTFSRRASALGDGGTTPAPPGWSLRAPADDMSASASPSSAAAGGGFARRRFLRAAPPSVPAPSAANQPITHTHARAFNGPLSGTNRVSRYQKGKTNLDFTEARDSEWQWHQLDHTQVCTSLQTDDHASTHHSVFYRPDALPAAQPTALKH